MNRRHLINSLILLCAGVAAFLFAWRLHAPKTSIPVLNEVCGVNFSQLADERGEYPDYIELYCPDDEAKGALRALYLSNDADDLKKFSLSEAPVSLEGYALIWCVGEEAAVDGTHAPFRLSGEGDFLFLSDESGSVLDTVALPALSYDVSYGRAPNGTGAFCAMEGTPGRSNDEAASVNAAHVPAPVLSVESGFYEEPFSLSLSAQPGLAVYYTTDGRVPDESANRYKAPLLLTDASAQDNVYANEQMYVTYTPPTEKVDKCHVIRAVAVDPATGARSETVTGSYFIGFSAKALYEDVPVVSLAVDPDDLFDTETGIYTMGRAYEEYKALGGFLGLDDADVPDHFVDEAGEEHWRYIDINASRRGRTSEREAATAWFDERHGLLFSQDAGLRIAGESSRSAFQKSLQLYARTIYDGRDVFAGAFFGRNDLSRLRLRSTGDEPLIFREAFLHALLGGAEHRRAARASLCHILKWRVLGRLHADGAIRAVLFRGLLRRGGGRALAD